MKFLLRIYSLLFIVAVLMTSAVSLCSAELEKEITADQVSVSTPSYYPAKDVFKPKLGKYEYKVAWEGIPAATAEINVEQKGLDYVVTSTAKTNSAISIFYSMKYKAVGDISSIDFRPKKTDIEQQENSRVKTTKISFGDDGYISARRQLNDKEPKLISFKPDNETLDPFSATFLARSLDWGIGKSYKFDTFNGKTRYLITLTAVGKDQIEVNGVYRNCFIVVPRVENLNNPSANSKLRDAKIYVSDDDSREILKIVSEVFIGSVTTSLQKYTPLPTGPNYILASK